MKKWFLGIAGDKVNLVAAVLLILFGGFLVYAALKGGAFLLVTTTVIGGIAALFTIVAAYVAIVSLNEWRDSHRKGLQRTSAAKVHAVALQMHILDRAIFRQLQFYSYNFQSSEEEQEARDEVSDLWSQSHRLLAEMAAACDELFAIDPQAFEHFNRAPHRVADSFNYAQEQSRELAGSVLTSDDVGGFYRMFGRETIYHVYSLQDISWQFYLNTYR